MKEMELNLLLITSNLANIDSKVLNRCTIANIFEFMLEQTHPRVKPLLSLKVETNKTMQFPIVERFFKFKLCIAFVANQLHCQLTTIINNINLIKNVTD